MKNILSKLRESIELPEGVIQFKIGNQFYELERLKDGNWVLFTIFGEDLKMDLSKLKGLSRPEVEELLNNRYANIEIY